MTLTRLRPAAWRLCLLAGLALGPSARAAASQAAPDALEADEVRWLEARSMLRQAAELARQYSGRAVQWRHPYGRPQPRAASEKASVWFTAYPASTLTRPGVSVLATLADARLWQAFETIGITGVHTGPMKRAGGVAGRSFTPTVDGGFDRIGFDIDPAFGTEADYKALVAEARARRAVVIGDVIPGHTGKGPDFRLAERAHADYPGLYHMVSVDREDWPLLPEVPSGRDAVNLSPATVDALRARGYIAGRLQRTFFHEPGIKDTDWSATPPVRGVDGVERRWVYLHYFKQGQPTLNWLDPSFAAARLVVGDVLHEIGTLGDAMIRLDANGYLGIEPDPGGGAWSQGHPLSVTANRLVAGMVRKLGGFTFQELNLTLEDLRAMSEDGADLSYDFVTRPAYHHALATGDAEFLRLMLRLMHEDGIDPASLIHALQNHDELTLELIHFWGAHKEKPFPFRGGRPRGAELRAQVHRDMFGALTGARASYNLKAGDGIACTTASLIAAALGYAEVARLAPPQVEAVKKAHLLLAFYNAFQPGIFALSGWDLVGALTLPAESVRERMADGDARWINRGAYDLLGAVPEAERSAAGLPRAAALYGPLPAQLADPASFASQLAKMLTLRAELKLHAARQTEVPEVRARGLLVMVHELPEGRGTQLSAINFGREPVDESVAVRGLAAGARVSELPGGAAAEPVGEGGRVHIRLASLEGKALLVGR